MGGDKNCEHEWGNEKIVKMEFQNNLGNNGSLEFSGQVKESKQSSQGQFCLKCSAWRGQLGLEPDIELYIAHLVDIFRECWRVLRRDGIFFLNISDTYYGSGGATGQASDRLNLGKTRKQRYYAVEGITQGKKHPILKPKDLCLIPERLAIALQEQGWWVRSDIIISKRNCMPESTRDRPTRSHEYMFMFTKSAKYFYDAEAIRETSIDPESFTGRRPRNIAEHGKHDPKNYKFMGSVDENGKLRAGMTYPKRNCRTVWEVVTEGYPGAHFATFGTKWIWRCIAAGTSERGCCIKCGAPYERILDKKIIWRKRLNEYGRYRLINGQPNQLKEGIKTKTVGWQPACKCYQQDGEDKTRPCVVLDPFAGACTTEYTAKRMGRKAISLELKWDYVKMGQKRCYSDQIDLDFTKA